MIDVGAKSVTQRSARARAYVRLPARAAEALRAATLEKGDAFTAAQLAGILAAKQTATLVPLAHTLPLSSVDVEFDWAAPGLLRIEARARTAAQTGVELEAMIAASVAALTIYDMTKSLDKGIRFESVALLQTHGVMRGSWYARVSGAGP